jgi:hypothetical protein
MDHLSEERLLEMASGNATDEEDSHVANCNQCFARLIHLVNVEGEC